MNGVTVLIFLFCAMMGAKGLRAWWDTAKEQREQQADPEGYRVRKEAEADAKARRRMDRLSAASDYAGFFTRLLKK